MSELAALRAELNPLGWLVLHDPWSGRWLAVSAREHATADTPGELRARILNLWRETATMPVIREDEREEASGRTQRSC